MKPNVRQLKRWTAALDSREYEPYRQYHGIPLGSFNWPVSIYWLFELDEDFMNKSGKSFFALYNVGNYTFPEIATLLELVYIHKMLD